MNLVWGRKWREMEPCTRVGGNSAVTVRAVGSVRASLSLGQSSLPCRLSGENHCVLRDLKKMISRAY